MRATLIVLLAISAFATQAMAQLAEELPIDVDKLRFAEQRGLEIFLRDQAAWLATDAVTIERLSFAGANGWVTTQKGDAWVVQFIGDCDGFSCILFAVEVDVEGRSTVVTEFDEPPALDDNLQAAWSARQLALQADWRPCSRSYNSVVVRETSDSDSKFIVYLLAATTDPDILVITGHHRISVTGDGKEILKNEALSNTCLNMKRADDTAAIVVTHPLSPYPLETHVFTSLNYGIPLYVGTDLAMFSVDKGKISVLEK